MFAVHGVFRDSLGAAPTLVGGIAPGDAERVALIANYYENILSFLQAHHDGEEASGLPAAAERCDGAAELIDHMAEQHHEALALLAQANARWRRGRVATRRRRRQPRSGLDDLCSHLNEHLAEEEMKVLPPGAARTSPWRSGVHSRDTAWPASTATRSG